MQQFSYILSLGGIDFPYSDRIFLTYLLFWVAGLYVGKHYDLVAASLSGVLGQAVCGAVILVCAGLAYLQYSGHSLGLDLNDVRLVADLLSIALVSAMGTSVTNMMLAISISNIPPFARIVRSAVLTIKNEEYIEAARAIGASDKRIILKHILPNCMAPIIVQATLSIAGSILAIASLSFIGLGISPPTPEWGSMVSTGRQYFRAAWWVCAFPGFAIMLTILSLNLLGDGLRDALDPKLKN